MEKWSGDTGPALLPNSSQATSQGHVCSQYLLSQNKLPVYIFTCSVMQETNVCSHWNYLQLFLCFKLHAFAKALAINVLMDPSSSSQKFLYHPGASCEAGGLRARLGRRHLHPVRLRLLFKAQTISRHTVHACLQPVVCGLLSSSVTALCLPCSSLPNAFKLTSKSTLYSCHNTYIRKIQEMLPALPWTRGERVACRCKKIFYLHRKTNSGVYAGRIKGKAILYLYIYLRNWIQFIF